MASKWLLPIFLLVVAGCKYTADNKSFSETSSRQTELRGIHDGSPSTHPDSRSYREFLAGSKNSPVGVSGLNISLQTTTGLSNISVRQPDPTGPRCKIEPAEVIDPTYVANQIHTLYNDDGCRHISFERLKTHLGGTWTVQAPDLSTPRPPARAVLELSNLSGLRIDGAGIKIVLNGLSNPYVNIRNSYQLELRNFIFDTGPYVATRGHIRECADGKGIQVDSNYQNVPTHRKVYGLQQIRAYGDRWERDHEALFVGPHVDPSARRDQHLLLRYEPTTKSYCPNPDAQTVTAQSPNDYCAANETVNDPLNQFPLNKPVLLRHEIYGQNGINILGPDTADITLRNIHIQSASAMGIRVDGLKRGFALLNSSIQRNNEKVPQTLTSTAADGLHIINSGGDIVVLNNTFAHTGDDAINIHTTTIAISAPDGLRASGLLKKHKSVSIRSGSRAYCFDGHMNPVGETKISRFGEPNSTDGMGLVHFQELPPSNCRHLVLYDFVPRRILIKNNRFRHVAGRGLVLQGSRALVRDNDFDYVGRSAVFIGGFLRLYAESPGVTDVRFVRNSISNSGYENPRISPLIVKTVFRPSPHTWFTAFNSYVGIEHNRINNASTHAVRIENLSNSHFDNNTTTGFCERQRSQNRSCPHAKTIDVNGNTIRIDYLVKSGTTSVSSCTRPTWLQNDGSTSELQFR